MQLTWTTECKDWERRVLNKEPLITFPPLFPNEAAESIAILKELRIKDIPGRPKLGEVGRQWLFDFASAIFGAYDPGPDFGGTEETAGRRLITEFFLLVSKKNSKSTTAAGIMLTALIRNWRESAEYLILAPTKEIANNSFYPARDMVNCDDELTDLLHVQEHFRQITHRESGATLKVVAADSETVGGKKATGILIDEAWLFGKKANAGNMLLEATGGLASRPEGFVIYLSTQSDEAPAGEFLKKLDYARDVRDGKIDDKKFLPVIYEFPKKILDKKEHLNPKMFYVTNPNLGASVDEEYIIDKYKKADVEGPESMQGFLAKHLNVEIEVSLRAQRWAGIDFWKDAAGEVDLDIILNTCEVIVIGIDGGGLDDLLGLAVLGRMISPNKKGKWLLWNKAWCHPIALERRKKEADRYKDLAKIGDLTIIKDEGQDLKEMGDIVRKCLPLLDRVGLDRHGLIHIVNELEGGDENGQNSISDKWIIAIPQGYQLNGPIKTTERALADKTLRHAGQPLMSWCVGNAKALVKGNNTYINKELSGSAKIDPLIATFNAVALMGMDPESRFKKSKYEGMTTKEISERIGL